MNCSLGDSFSLCLLYALCFLFISFFYLYRSLDSNSHVFADENHSLGKNIKKKKNKTQENGKDLNMNTSLLSVDKKADDKSSQVWTLSNGLILEVLEMGKPDSKVAVSGKKASPFE